MSWWRRRRRSLFDDIFEEMMEEFERINELMRTFMEEDIRRLMQEGGKPLVYGVRITIGPDGVPKIEEFGNVKVTKTGKPVVSEEMEPLVDVMEVDDEVWVIAELPGVPKEKIKVRVTEDKVYIRAEDGRKYYKVVDLPATVDPDTAKASYRNGVLEIRIKKKAAKEEGKEVKVE